jgi:hypothetical protein
MELVCFLSDTSLSALETGLLPISMAPSIKYLLDFEDVVQKSRVVNYM